MYHCYFNFDFDFFSNTSYPNTVLFGVLPFHIYPLLIFLMDLLNFSSWFSRVSGLIWILVQRPVQMPLFFSPWSICFSHDDFCGRAVLNFDVINFLRIFVYGLAFEILFESFFLLTFWSPVPVWEGWVFSETSKQFLAPAEYPTVCLRCDPIQLDITSGPTA